MSGRQRSQTPYKELRDFFTFLYEDKIGFAYSPTKNPGNGVWEENYFRWPEQERELIKHVLREQSNNEVYISPGLFRNAGAEKEDFLGSNVIWAELDYGVPTERRLEELGLPKVSVRVRSSTPDHEHWYWKLDYFESNADNLESLNKRIVYALDGDLGTWNCNRVLRPPRTTHHESGKKVELVESTPGAYSITPFILLDDPPVGEGDYRSEVDLEGLPDILDVIATYKWPEKALELFKGSGGKDRSNTMCSLAYYCAEMGMEDKEVMTVINAVDLRWKKFTGRNDRMRCLTGVLLRARLKYPLLISKNEDDHTDEFLSYSFRELLTLDIRFEWAIEKLVQKHGLAIITSQPGVGKTQMSMQAAMAAAVGKPFLQWEVPNPRNVVFFSLEMWLDDIMEQMKQQVQTLTEEEMELFYRNFRLVPLGESIHLDKPGTQAKMLRYLEKNPATGIFIDSLSHSMSKSPNDEEVVGATFAFLRGRIIKDMDAYVWFVHHDRKPNGQNKRPDTLADVYGSQFIERDMTTGINLWKTDPKDPWSPIEVTSTKLRMATQFESFVVKRLPSLTFEITNGAAGGSSGSSRLSGNRPQLSDNGDSERNSPSI